MDLAFINLFLPITHTSRLIVWPKSHKLLQRELSKFPSYVPGNAWEGDDGHCVTWAADRGIINKEFGTIQGQYITVEPGSTPLLLSIATSQCIP